jgi:alpha,alpha-trehalose phosphorylase
MNGQIKSPLTMGWPARALTGPGYDRRACWDTEIRVLPRLTCAMPLAAVSAAR